MTLVTRSAYRLSRRAAAKNVAAFSTAAAKAATPIFKAAVASKVTQSNVRAKEGECLRSVSVNCYEEDWQEKASGIVCWEKRAGDREMERQTEKRKSHPRVAEPDPR
jgi:hypothetical protein